MPRPLPQNSSSWAHIEREREAEKRHRIEQRRKNKAACYVCGTFEKRLRSISKEGHYLVKICDDCAREGAHKLREMSEKERNVYLEGMWGPLKLEEEASCTE